MHLKEVFFLFLNLVTDKNVSLISFELTLKDQIEI